MSKNHWYTYFYSKQLSSIKIYKQEIGKQRTAIAIEKAVGYDGEDTIWRPLNLENNYLDIMFIKKSMVIVSCVGILIA